MGEEAGAVVGVFHVDPAPVPVPGIWGVDIDEEDMKYTTARPYKE